MDFLSFIVDLCSLLLSFYIFFHSNDSSNINVFLGTPVFFHSSNDKITYVYQNSKLEQANEYELIDRENRKWKKKKILICLAIILAFSYIVSFIHFFPEDLFSQTSKYGIFGLLLIFYVPLIEVTKSILFISILMSLIFILKSWKSSLSFKSNIYEKKYFSIKLVIDIFLLFALIMINEDYLIKISKNYYNKLYLISFLGIGASLIASFYWINITLEKYYELNRPLRTYKDKETFIIRNILAYFPQAISSCLLFVSLFF